MNSKKHRQQGIALMTTLILAGVIGTILVSLMLWAGGHNLLTYRSMAWNSALGVAEAGVEEALAQLTSHQNSRTANNWTFAGGVYTKTRNFGDGYYTVTISTNQYPTIISQGFVKVPLKTNNYISRTVCVTTTNNSQFYAGLVTKLTIDMNGNNVDVDSYDPSNPQWSTNGQWDPTKRHDQGNIATVSGFTNAFSVGNANIYGKIATGPGGTMTIGPNGSVGDVAWHANGNTGIESGFQSHDMTATFPPVVAPTATAVPPGGKISGVTYQYILGNGNYIAGDLTGNVYVTGNATLTVTNKLKAQTISFAPGASLQMYVSVASATFSGVSVMNQGGASTNFQYYGLPSNTSVAFSGNTAFTGIIYAPSASVSMGGGGGTPVDVSGALVSSSLTMNGRFNVHYDESLHRLPTGLVMATWTEL